MFKRYTAFLSIVLCLQTSLMWSAKQATSLEERQERQRRDSAADLQLANNLWKNRSSFSVLYAGQETVEIGGHHFKSLGRKPSIKLAHMTQLYPCHVVGQPALSAEERKPQWRATGTTWEIYETGGVRKETAENIKMYTRNEQTNELRKVKTISKDASQQEAHAPMWSPRRSFFVTLIVGITGLKWWSTYKQSVR